MKNIFLLAILISMFFSGISKIIFFPYTKRTIQKITFIKNPINKWMPYLMPTIEIVVPLLIFIIGENLLLYSLIMLYYFVFIALNLTSMYDDIDCCCYGKFIKSKLGVGGVIHYVYFLFVEFLSIYCYLFNGTLITIYMEKNLYIRFFVAVLLCVNGLIYRKILEITLEKY